MNNDFYKLSQNSLLSLILKRVHIDGDNTSV